MAAARPPPLPDQHPALPGAPAGFRRPSPARPAPPPPEKGGAAGPGPGIGPAATGRQPVDPPPPPPGGARSGRPARGGSSFVPLEVEVLGSRFKSISSRFYPGFELEETQPIPRGLEKI